MYKYLCIIVLYYCIIVLYCMYVLYCIVLYCIVLYCIVLYCIVLYVRSMGIAEDNRAWMVCDPSIQGSHSIIDPLSLLQLP
jgi:hypothetical protein